MISFDKKLSVVFIISLIVSMLFTVPVFSEETPHSATADTHSAGTYAAETGEAGSNTEGHSSDRSADLRDLAYRYLNFILLIIILVIVFKKTRILDYFATRSEEIRQRLEDLKKEKDEAERKYKEIENQLRDFEAKRNGIIEQYRQEGMHEKDRIISDAKERVKQILEQSEITIQQEIESARNQLKHDIMDIASKRAQDILVKELDEKDQENMVVEFVEKVGKVN